MEPGVSAGGVVGLALALAFASGALLVYDGLTRPRQSASPRAPGPIGAAEDRLRVFLRAAELEMPVRTFVFYSLGCGLGCAVLTQQLLGWPVTTVLAFGGGTV